MSFTTTTNQEDLVASLSRNLVSSIIKNETSFQYETTLSGFTVLVTIYTNEARTNIKSKFSFQNDSSLSMFEFSNVTSNFTKEFKHALGIAFHQVTKEKIL